MGEYGAAGLSERCLATICKPYLGPELTICKPSAVLPACKPHVNCSAITRACDPAGPAAACLPAPACRLHSRAVRACGPPTSAGHLRLRSAHARDLSTPAGRSCSRPVHTCVPPMLATCPRPRPPSSCQKSGQVGTAAFLSKTSSSAKACSCGGLRARCCASAKTQVRSLLDMHRCNVQPRCFADGRVFGSGASQMTRFLAKKPPFPPDRIFDSR